MTQHTTGNEDWRPERETRAQREWVPGQRKQQSSIRKLFAATVLYCEALALFFYGLLMVKKFEDSGMQWWLAGSFWALGVFAVVAARMLKTNTGYIMGWIISIAMFLAGFFETTAFFVGIGFIGAWAYAVIKGHSIDVENERREIEQLEWEAAHPEEA